MSDEFRVKVIAGTRTENVVVLPDGRYLVSVKAKRERGAANMRVRELLAQYFKVPLPRVNIRSGHTSATKAVSVRR